ncbi:MAG: M61 family metallopeptidase [Phycisphaerae bacterium]|nr:M61 family metallopeptidase [Phycisphaerae bacterium]
MSLLPARVLLALTVLPALMLVPAQRVTGQTGPVRYALDLTHAPQQTIAVAIDLAGVAAEHVDLHLPVWRPGLYAILDQAGTVRDVTARAPDGRTLPVSKTDKATWRITAQGAASLRIDYTLWAGSLENRTRHADDTHAFISPSAVCMYSPAWRALPAEVSIIAPLDWAVATGLPADPTNPRRLLAADYDTLVDSPIEVGLHHRATFLAQNIPHEVITWTGEPAALRDTPASIYASPRFAKFPADLARIADVQVAIFGSVPYDRYVFLLHCYPGGRGGTEHLNSTIIQCAPAAFFDDDAYARLLQLSAHELFHTWNVKRFRPSGLVPYDYQRENYTDALWLAEGTTSYYEDITLLRAGLMKPADFLKALGKSIHDHRQRPGRHAQSLAESSFDAWIKHNRKTPDAPNSTISFYDEGALASLALDLEIRRRTGGARSLDHALRLLFQRFPSPALGYTTADIISALSDAAGSDLADFHARHIQGRQSPDFESLLTTVGLRLGPASPKPPAPGLPAPPPLRARAGLVLKDQSGLAHVETVLADGPAVAAGIIPGDILLALDGRRVRADAWDKLLDRVPPESAVALTLFRHDALREVRLTLAPEPRTPLDVTPDPEATPDARAAFRAWTGTDLPPAPRSAGTPGHKPPDAPAPASPPTAAPAD